jgi:FG-GAP-like repeat/Abnormal spindle-like microcephaly-assoc'd, ASPM-SPD-2-Hydin/Salmonella virulence plasmid 65kDa B protein
MQVHWARFMGAGRRCASNVGVLALTLCLGLQAGGAQAQVTVTDAGSPSWQQSLSLPPGAGGLTPQLAVSYAPSGVNGPLGLGWSVQGLSVITRCAATIATDGVKGGVSFTASDKLCLDGQRLIQTQASGEALPFPQTGDAQGSGDGAYREYRTEREVYARVRAYGYANGDTSGASGPAWFRVWTKAGQVYDYGASPAATSTANALITAPGKAPMAWAVARISDTTGNTIDIRYEQRDVAWGSNAAGVARTGHEWNVVEIHYGANKVLFNFDTDANGNDLRTDRGEAYQNGSKNVSIRRLKSITSYINSPSPALGANGGTPVKTWRLSYDAGPQTGRSRLTALQECAGGPSSTRCMPAATFGYSAGGTPAYVSASTFAASTLARTDLVGATAGGGVFTGDFNGDGKTDLMAWSDTPSSNRLFLSKGDGSFDQTQLAYNIVDINLNKSDGCYYSIAADFNGDGITDILRIMRANATSSGKASCGTVTNLLLLGSPTGVFSRVTLPSSISFTQTATFSQYYYNCLTPKTDYYLAGCLEPGNLFLGKSQTAGANYHLMDVNGDGYLDIVTTVLPAYARTTTIPSEQDLCAASVCTHVYLGSSTGTFAELSTTNVAHRSLYADPPSTILSFMGRPYVLDFNGDGVSDLLVNSGLWLSTGDGNFSFATNATYGVGCTYPIDVNGDGRSDCIFSSSGVASNQSLVIGDGTYAPKTTTTFNLTATGQELFQLSSLQRSAGMQIADFNGDGRQDILRWKDDSSQNALYLSNGDGGFSLTSGFTVNGGAPTLQLQKSDGTATLLAGDFTGQGNVELLRLQTLNGTAANQLLVRADPTPPDQLTQVTSSTGLTSQLYYVSITHPTPSAVATSMLGSRYQSDLGGVGLGVPNAVEVASPLQVVTTIVSDSGVAGQKLRTELSYQGLKADRLGRGPLGFRSVLRQTSTPDGSPMTVATQFAQVFPYVGSPVSAITYLGSLDSIASALQVKTTSQVYCDIGNASAASTSAHCPFTGKIARPFTYQRVERSADLGGRLLSLVTVTSSYGPSGDPTRVDTVTSGNSVGIDQSFVKSVITDYLGDDTSCSDAQTCAWILGRPSQVKTSSTVPNLLPSITNSAGNGPFASAIQGSGVLQKIALAPAGVNFGGVAVGSTTTQTVTVTNAGVSPVQLTALSNSAVSGDDFGWVSSDCPSTLSASASCNVVVRFAPSAAVSRSGTLNVVTSGGSASAALSGVGQQGILALSYPGGGTINWGDQQIGGSYGSAQVTLTNSGNITVTGLVVAVSNSWSLTGSTCGGSLAAGTSCTFVVVWSPTVAQAMSGQVTVVASNAASPTPLGLQGQGRSPSLAKVGADNFSFYTPMSTGSGHFVGVQNNGVGPVTVNSLSYSTTSGNFNAWMGSSGSGNPGGGYCWPGAVLQPGWACGAWANADSGAGTVTFNTTAGAVSFNGSFTAQALSYGGPTSGSLGATSGVTGAAFSFDIVNGTRFNYYFPRYGAGGGLSSLGRFVGGNAGNFNIVASTCGASLPAGSSCSVSVGGNGMATAATTYASAFQPNGTFQQQGDGSNNPWAGPGNWLVNMGTSVADVYVTATLPVSISTWTVPDIVPSTTQVSGSSRYPTPVTSTVSFTNNGQTPTTLSLSMSGGISVSPASLYCPASSSCGTVTLTSGGDIKTYTGTLTVSSSAGGNVQNVAVDLREEGVIAQMASSTALSFGTVTQGASVNFLTWSVKNAGNADMTLTLSSLNPPFRVLSNDCLQVLIAPGLTCVINVALDTSTPGTYSQTGISLGGASLGNRSDLSLSATVSSSLPFKGAGLSTSGSTGTWTFTNPNGSAQTVTSVTLEKSGLGLGARVSGGTCTAGASIAANATCTVTVSAPAATCKSENYSVRPTLVTAGGTATGASYWSRSSSQTICP